jgi:hypothetical protein
MGGRGSGKRGGNPQNLAPIKPGESRNPKGSSALQRSRRQALGERPAIVLWDLKMAARAHCPKALQRAVELLDDEDKRVRLAAIEIVLERGYGRAEVHADVTLTCNFAEVPEVMPVDEWLRRKGQPAGAAGDEWLERQLAKPEPGKRTSEPPSAQAGHSSGAPTIDLKAEEALLLDADPTAPPPPGSKLN